MIYCNGARGRRKGCATGEGIERKGKSASIRGKRGERSSGGRGEEGKRVRESWSERRTRRGRDAQVARRRNMTPAQMALIALSSYTYTD